MACLCFEEATVFDACTSISVFCMTFACLAAHVVQPQPVCYMVSQAWVLQQLVSCTCGTWLGRQYSLPTGRPCSCLNSASWWYAHLLYASSGVHSIMLLVCMHVPLVVTCKPLMLAMLCCWHAVQRLTSTSAKDDALGHAALAKLNG
ncbi:hypothetical protein COO60DRAFT_1522158 [Scenedesmus sp. NREL 46B-D3]|nr:hypothetical protein COO60DRAFT_1522158 [Scenedesmus sp. NREL 46B-D3]